jgi:hypothetical protein
VSDLTSRRWIVLKGGLFLAIAVVAALLIGIEAPSWRVVTLLILLAWASARFYYFLFYVLERYVDPRLKYAGILAMLRTLLLRGRSSRPKP